MYIGDNYEEFKKKKNNMNGAMESLNEFKGKYMQYEDDFKELGDNLLEGFMKLTTDLEILIYCASHLLDAEEPSAYINSYISDELTDINKKYDFFSSISDIQEERERLSKL